MATSAIYFHQTAGTRRALASIFSSIEELDANHKKQIARIYDETKFRKDKKQRLVRLLNIIKTHSVCEKQGYLGVCFLSIKSMLDLFERRYGQKISERCAQYLLSDLEKLGHIDRIETIRTSDHRQSTNIYRMKKVESDVSVADDGGQGSEPAAPGEAPSDVSAELAPKDQGNLHPKKADLSLKAHLQNQEHSGERKTPARVSLLDKISEVRNGISNSMAKMLRFIPRAFKELFAAITTTPQEVREFWQITKLVCMKHHGLAPDLAKRCWSDAFVEFYESCKAASRGKFTMHNPFGFYYGVINAHAGGTARLSSGSNAADKARGWLEG